MHERENIVWRGIFFTDGLVPVIHIPGKIIGDQKTFVSIFKINLNSAFCVSGKPFSTWLHLEHFLSEMLLWRAHESR